MIATTDEAIQVFNNRGMISQLYAHLIKALCNHYSDGYGERVRMRKSTFNIMLSEETHLLALYHYGSQETNKHQTNQGIQSIQSIYRKKSEKNSKVSNSGYFLMAKMFILNFSLS